MVALKDAITVLARAGDVIPVPSGVEPHWAPTPEARIAVLVLTLHRSDGLPVTPTQALFGRLSGARAPDVKLDYIGVGRPWGQAAPSTLEANQFPLGE